MNPGGNASKNVTTLNRVTHNMEPSTCCLCGVTDAEGKALLNTTRLPIVRFLTTDDVTAHSRGHASCFARFGLDRVPTNAAERAAFERDIHRNLSRRVVATIESLPRRPDLREMCDQAWTAVAAEYDVADAAPEYAAEMQRLVRNYVADRIWPLVATRRTGRRGAISPAAPIAPWPTWATTAERQPLSPATDRRGLC